MLGVLLWRNATSPKKKKKKNTRWPHRLCAFAMTHAHKHRCGFNGAVEQTVCGQTPDGQFPPRPGCFRRREGFLLKSGWMQLFAKCSRAFPFKMCKEKKKKNDGEIIVFPSTFEGGRADTVVGRLVS